MAIVRWIEKANEEDKELCFGKEKRNNFDFSRASLDKARTKEVNHSFNLTEMNKSPNLLSTIIDRVSAKKTGKKVSPSKRKAVERSRSCKDNEMERQSTRPTNVLSQNTFNEINTTKSYNSFNILNQAKLLRKVEKKKEEGFWDSFGGFFKSFKCGG